MPSEPPDDDPQGSGIAKSGSTGSRFKPCPICRKPATPEARPFCSKRCADVDLHRWLGGTYAVPIPDEESGLAEGDEEPL